MSRRKPQNRSHKQPRDFKEYMEAYQQNSRVFGFGMTTTQILPCPFCAAPDFVSAPILSIHEVVENEHTCSECGRSGKCLSMPLPGGGVTIELVQTEGADAPDWLVPRPRRVNTEV